MLKFIEIYRPSTVVFEYFKTSYVEVYRKFEVYTYVNFCYFKTSYVEVYPITEDWH